ncbi:sensor histidine kinase, partial [Vibrio parahaemolyticus]
LDNALKYAGRAEVQLEENDNWVKVTITDSGPGIPNHKLEAVFEPYYRLAHDTEGHGLGLGICRNILHGHGGDLTLSNLPKGGLKVEVLIPSGLEV